MLSKSKFESLCCTGMDQGGGPNFYCEYVVLTICRSARSLLFTFIAWYSDGMAIHKKHTYLTNSKVIDPSIHHTVVLSTLFLFYTTF